MKTENVIVKKSKEFSLRKKLCGEKREFLMSKQLLRSGTNIGANVKEAIRAQSKADFYAKMSISLKEASEAEYWLEILHESGYIGEDDFSSIYFNCQEILKILIAITKHQNN